MTTETASAPATSTTSAAPSPAATVAPAASAPDLASLPMRERIARAAAGPEATEGANPAKPTTEAPAAKADGPEDVKAKRFALAAKMEREAKTKRDAMAEKAKKLDAWEKEQAELATLKDSDPAAYLERLGVKFEDFAARILDRKEPTEAEKALEAERKEREALAKKIADMEAEREQERAAIAKRAEDEFIRAGKEALEAQRAEFSLLLAEPDSDVLVMEYLEGVARKSGRVIPYLEACKHIQGALEEKYSTVLQTEWARGKLAPVSSERAAPAKSESGQHPRTLTNAHASEGRTYTPDELAALPMRQRIAIAAAGMGKR